jgi:hypothetical protein
MDEVHEARSACRCRRLAFAACSSTGSSSAPAGQQRRGGGGDKGTVKIAIELPLQGSELAARSRSSTASASP